MITPHASGVRRVAPRPDAHSGIEPDVVVSPLTATASRRKYFGQPIDTWHSRGRDRLDP